MARSVLGRGTARERVLEAAMALFGEHGVNGTSLQMIAARLGVGKAAVYYQFRSKEDLVLAVVEPIYDDMARLVTIAEALSTAEARRDVVVSGLIEMCVRHRRLAAVLYGDPAVDSLVQSRPELAATVEQFTALVTGGNLDTHGRVILAMIVNGIYTAAIDPNLADISDADLLQSLQAGTRHLIKML
ncbi:helix-turn-helix domain-containing protein [[Mycobacterium] wendilense]|uniref:Helix-turn-helix domain-containing protein n=1 Tax=[Mycobacterium] wendilense TaxID=3064284 RepID=A0ABM9MKQ3_9MYCO|nr:helix-turn-helix domain-containing protein [Mycolicibacterium sp. MU0050]CAJ1587657.1 helix-turn-helix domain-containing protein [Mycolicibacterium sp. MU0050]